MFDALKKILSHKDPFIPRSKSRQFDKIFQELRKKYPTGEDAWGLNLQATRKTLDRIWPFYQNYFQVRVFGKKNVPEGPCMIIANHSGQVAIDGLLISTAFVTEISQPRILRPMVERFFTAIPFINRWASEGGSVLGDRQNCINLLNRGESVLVFPEGVKGISKSTSEYYQLQKFTRGFFRLAVSANVPILPLSIIGAEEFYPLVYQARGLAKFLNLPALPITPHLIPLPSPVDIHIGAPYTPPKNLTYDSPDGLIDEHVAEIEKQIAHMISNGLKKRRPFWANTKGPKK